MTTADTRTLSFVDKIRRDWYLARLSLHIVGLPQKSEQSTRRQLRIDITDSAQDRGMSQALSELGPPRVLAHEFLEAYGRPVPKVWTGVVVFALMLYGGLFALISVMEGLISGALAADPNATASLSKSWLGSVVEVDIRNGLLDSMGFSITPLALGLLVLVPLLCTQFWRVWRKPQKLG